MSDTFLLVVPAGWSELPDGQAFVDQHTEAQLMDLLGSNQLAAVEAMLQDGGHIAPTASIVDFRMFRELTNYRIWYRLG